MQKILHHTFFLAMGICAMVSCSKTDGGGGGGGGSASKGIIKGTVNVYDDKGNQNADDKANVKVVVLNGTTEVGSATTVTAGNYTLANIPFGTYDLAFSRADIGLYKLFGVQVSNSNVNSTTTVSTVQLGQISGTSITDFTYVDNTFGGAPGASYTISVSPSPSASGRGYFRIFLGTNANVSKDNYGNYTAVRSIISNNATGGFSQADLNTLGFTSGQTVYMIAYGESPQTNEYTDPSTGKKVFPNLNAVNRPAIPFIVP
jgi:uncharacterized surface anchored protein